MRSRNQPGNDFRCYVEIVLSSTLETYEAEGIVKKTIQRQTNSVNTKSTRTI